MTNTQVETKKVQDRRSVHYKDLHEILADVDLLDTQTRTHTGNWTPAQNLEHLTRVIEASLDGFSFSVPWYMRIPATLLSGRFQRKGFPAGITPPPSAASFLPDADTTWEAARDHFRRVMQRLDSGERMNQRSPLFGDLTHEAWAEIHCRHAELHMSFVRGE